MTREETILMAFDLLAKAAEWATKKGSEADCETIDRMIGVVSRMAADAEADMQIGVRQTVEPSVN